MDKNVRLLGFKGWNLNGVICFAVEIDSFSSKYILRIEFVDGLPRYDKALYDLMSRNNISREEANKIVDHFDIVVKGMAEGDDFLDYVEWNTLPGIEVISMDI